MARRLLLGAVVMSLLLVACGGGGATAAPGDSATRLAQTAEAILTATVKARETPAPATQEPATQSPQTQPTTAPAATASAACANDSKFVSDVTIPDGTHLAPNAAFIKVWRIRNTGTCPWTTAYEYRFIGGDQLGGANIRLPNDVQPNDTLDISISFTAPASAGSYRSQWRLFAPGGTPFGQRPYVLISVP